MLMLLLVDIALRRHWDLDLDKQSCSVVAKFLSGYSAYVLQKESSKNGAQCSLNE
jgi:hypothetical protein